MKGSIPNIFWPWPPHWTNSGVCIHKDIGVIGIY
jgi:hypothetical protein